MTFSKCSRTVNKLAAMFSIAAIFFSSLAFAGITTVFGPETFVIKNHESNHITRTFQVQDTSAPYTIRIVSSNSKFDAEVKLNGKTVFGNEEYRHEESKRKKIGIYEKTISLLHSNSLKVELEGRSGSQLTITIVGTSTNLDTTPPTISATVNPPPNAAGWNNSNVTVTFACSDAMSGVASCPSPVMVTTEGAGQIISGIATDRTGNSATANVSVNIDKTPPTVSITFPLDGSPQVDNAPLTVMGVVNDASSNIGNVTCNSAQTSFTSASFTCDLALISGDNTVTVEVTDVAGNKQATTISVLGVDFIHGLYSGPVILSEPPTATLVGKPLQSQVRALSSKPMTLQYSLSTAPVGMSLDSATGLLTWTPDTNQVGDQSVTIIAQDSVGQTSLSFTLSVFGSRLVASIPISTLIGGVISVNDPTSSINGLTISIPPGALATDKIISVSELITPATLGGSTHFLMKGFSIDPDGTALNLPATITVPYSASEFNTSEGIPVEEFLGGYYIDSVTGKLVGLQSTTVDTSNHVVTVAIPHFSVYEITNVARLCPPPTPHNDCPNVYSSSILSSQLPPVILVHGFQATVPSILWGGTGMGSEVTWGIPTSICPTCGLRNLLNGMDGHGSKRIEAWRFDWDSVNMLFEKSASNLATAITKVKQQTTQQKVNLLAHSFGGILVRTYLQGQANTPGMPFIEFPPSRQFPDGSPPLYTPLAYRGDVSKVMTIGTPHQGIGGDYSTWPATTCALRSTYELNVTCYEMATGLGGGIFLSDLNNRLLPALDAYDIIIGQQMYFSTSVSPYTPSGRLPSPVPLGVALAEDDGLITLKGAGMPCISNNSCPNAFQQETIAQNISDPIGLCHSGVLFDLPAQTCYRRDVNTTNVAMVEVNDKMHPLWQKICEFLGGDLIKCQPNLNVTLSDPAGGTVSSLPAGISCGQTNQICTANYPPIGATPQVVTLTVTEAAGFKFTGWSGDCAIDGKVVMTKDQSCKANFSSNVVQISLISDASVLGIANGGGAPSADTSGYSWQPVFLDDTGSFTPIPPGAPIGTMLVNIPPPCGFYCGQSGLVRATFMLPPGITTIELSGIANVDDVGSAYINGNLLTSALTQSGDTTFSTNNVQFFREGVNELIISDINSGGGPSGVAFFANITYSQ